MVDADRTMVDELAQIILERHGLSDEDRPIIEKYLNEAIWKILTETRAMATKRTIPDFDPGVLDVLEDQLASLTKTIDPVPEGESVIRKDEDGSRE